jgi:RHS repeat-associated protein
VIKVDDTGDKFAGFIDGATLTTEYTYDLSGNMITDQNKGITTAITYNFLNLPELITRGTSNTIRYIYDAAGRKLAQVTTYNASQVQTDYLGELQYENDALTQVNHEEGRIVTADRQTLFVSAGDNVNDGTPSNSTVALVTQNGGQTYLRVTSNGTVTKTGLFPIGGTFTVSAGERYLVRAKGYRTGANTVHLLIRAGTTDLGWPGSTLAHASTAEAWTEQEVTIPAGNTTLQAGVAWNTVTSGQQFFLNDFEIIRLGSTTPEYQYNLKDHLGNVRVTFSTKYEAPQYTATLEDATQVQEQDTFENYSRVTNDLFDHTDAGTVYDKTQLLNGGVSGQVGLSKSLAVVPGDTIVAEVYAKYFGTEGGPGNLTGFAAALTGAFGLSAAAGGDQLLAYNALNNYGGLVAAGTAHGYDAGWPKGYLTVLVFNKDYVLVDAAWQQLDAAYVQTGATKMPHGLLSRQVIIKEPGYAYIYLSNEGAVQQDIYFDDLTVTHKKSPIVQGQEYYPFGLTFNSYQKEGGIDNQYLYNGKERQDELDIGWMDYGARMYSSELGRFLGTDPLASKFEHLSPYNYASNDPILKIDLWGLQGVKYYDKANDRIVVEHNTVVLTHGAKSAPPGATEKEINETKKENSRNQASDNSRISEIKASVTEYLNHGGQGAKDEDGNKVYFKVNVIERPVDDPSATDVNLGSISNENGIDATTQGVNTKAVASVVTTDDSGADLGQHEGVEIKQPAFNAPKGTYAHEYGHRMGLLDNKRGSLMAYPPERISREEVTNILRKAFDKKQ